MSTCLGWPNGEKRASTCVRIWAWLKLTHVITSQRKWMVKRNTSWTQIENLRRLANPFGQGLWNKVRWFSWLNCSWFSTQVSESPPGEGDVCDEAIHPDRLDCSMFNNILSDVKLPRKDTGMSSGSSGVSSGSSLSHSPSASQSSTSSVSPRQESPLGWQHDSDYIWGTYCGENVTLPPPPTISDAPRIWSSHNHQEVGISDELNCLPFGPWRLN